MLIKLHTHIRFTLYSVLEITFFFTHSHTVIRKCNHSCTVAKILFTVFLFSLISLFLTNYARNVKPDLLSFSKRLLITATYHVPKLLFFLVLFFWIFYFVVFCICSARVCPLLFSRKSVRKFNAHLSSP